MMHVAVLGNLLALARVVPLSIGVIADDLVDYSTWAKPYADLWRGEEIERILAAHGTKPSLLPKQDLTLEGLSRFDAVLVATDHTYPERGPWGGPVAKALVEYVRRGGIYVMPIGVPHYISKDLETGALDRNHWEDFFGLRGSARIGRLPLALTRQGREIGLPDPGHVSAPPARQLNFAKAAVLVWGAGYTPCLSAAPFGKGWVIHWGAGESMDRSVRDFLVPAYAAVIGAAKGGRLRAMTRAALMAEEGLAEKSMDDMDREAFAPGPSPFHSEATVVRLLRGNGPPLDHKRPSLPLDGRWQMLGLPKGTGDERELVHDGGWDDAIPAEVPCSAQTALFAAGKIPDPTVGFNDRVARQQVADNEWWFRREFDWKQSGPARLVFDGVDYSATFYLNGVRLGEHEGPFGGPVFDVTGVVREHNSLIIRLDPLPPDWKLVFKTNCVYGWHYVNCPPIGIWRSVRIESVPSIEVSDLFVAATDAQSGTVDVSVELRGRAKGFSGVLEGRVRPANFEGDAYHFALPVRPGGSRLVRHLRFSIPDARLWWPNDLGEQNLYRLELAVRAGARIVDARSSRFGVRTIRMQPLPSGPEPDLYNWTFTINGRKTFVKGCNWCTLDAFLRLSDSRYRRFLTLAKDAHVQIMRSWGGGLLETDTFYDICDELGIMVWQEFPLTWQNFDAIRPAVADEIAQLNVRRLRNHPSLALWCGGNEHQGTGWLIELLGRRCLELDGTRPYHRTDPYGGSIHNYDVYWGMQPLERNIALGTLAPFIGEFGLASPCAVESTLKFLPEDERAVWPPPDSGTFIHHTPTFTPTNMDHLNRYAREFDACEDLAGFTRGSQLAQATGIRLTLERMRCRWPEATGVIYYKLTDVYPGCSWSTVDWYGVPKIAHYVVQDAFAPLHICALYETLDFDPGSVMRAQIELLDDAEALSTPARVRVRLFDGALRQAEERSFAVEGPADRVRGVGEVALRVPSENATPVFLVVELESGHRLADRAVYWFNFRARPGCLFAIPRTSVAARREGNEIVVANTGVLPAVGVHVEAPDCSDCLRLSDGYFWLDPGETRRVRLQLMPNTEGVTEEPGNIQIAAWNADPETL